MGQTLTHGVYLPDEGERNCYSGLAANWTILDGAVGTIAEHSTQIAGKAPAVHTHTKADITDLFNSDNTWSGNNTFTKTINSSHLIALSSQYANVQLGAIPSTDQALSRFQCNDKDNDTLCYFRQFYQSSGTNTFQIFVRNKFANGTPSTSGTYDYAYLGIGIESDKSPFAQVKGKFIPYSTNTYDLGSSSYQWNNLYAKNYYYNGTAWGLDKANVWSDSNRFTKSINLGNITSYTDCAMGFTGLYNVLFFNTRGSTNITSYGTYVYYGYSNASSDRGAIIRMVRTTDKRGDTNDGYIPDTSFNLYKISPEKLFIDFMEAVRVTNNGTENSLKPITNNTTDLGTSTNKWKTLNGVNPGALSIFNPSASYDPIDIPTSWDTLGSSWNTLSVSNLGDGWVCITYNNCSAGDYIIVRFGGTSGARYPSLRFDAVKASDNKYYIYALFPVAKAFSNIYLEMLINSNANLVLHHYIPAYGTV